MMAWLMRRLTRLMMIVGVAVAPGALLGVHRAGIVGVLLRRNRGLMLLYSQMYK